ncbi:hypothetical protein HY489_04510 [Candidatus Woesearchaeota archaeon]|nr:hypothetical protein [Candidatus Woesearchaeota archaeon]
MEKDDAGKVHELARRLKELHLVASMEEAIRRAKVILSDAKEGEQSIGQLMGEQRKKEQAVEKFVEVSRNELAGEAADVERKMVKDLVAGKRSKSQVAVVREQVHYDDKLHRLEKGDVRDALKDVGELDCAIEDTETILKQAEKVKKKK